MDRAEFLDRARSLVPGLRERAAACEASRRLPDETVKELHETGLLRGLQPRRWGGSEIDPWTFYEAVMEVSTACASTGWVLGVLGVHNWQLPLFSELAQRDVWGEDPSVQVSSSYAPTGNVERVRGGFRISGRWSFSSGCDHCGWVFLGGFAPGEGPPDLRTFLVPRSDYQIVDNWHVAGLCGTGSKDIAVDGAFVPEHRTHRFADAFVLKSPGQATNDGALYRLPFGCVFSSAVAAPAIGAARGALALFGTTSRNRQSAFGGGRASEDRFIQARAADARAEIEAAQNAMASDWRELIARADARAELPLLARLRTRCDANRAVGRSVAAVDRLFEASGGHAIYLDHPLQRVFRDVHAMRAHAINQPDRAAVMAGRFELSPETSPTEAGDLFF